MVGSRRSEIRENKPPSTSSISYDVSLLDACEDRAALLVLDGTVSAVLSDTWLCLYDGKPAIESTMNFDNPRL